MRVHPRLHQRIERAIDHRRRAAGIDMQRFEIAEVLSDRFVQHAAAPFPATDVTDHPVQMQIAHALPFIPVRQLVEIFRPPHAPVQMHRMHEARGAAVLDQAVHLRHAGAGSDQHQRAIR